MVIPSDAATQQDFSGACCKWREGQHDDLVLAVALACWYGEHEGESSYIATEPSDELWEQGDAGWRVVSRRRDDVDRYPSGWDRHR